MTGRIRIALVTLLCAAFVSAAVVLMAQVPVPPAAPDARIISGADIGFRVEGRDGPNIKGTLMLRINGRWVPVGGHGLTPLQVR